MARAAESWSDPDCAARQRAVERTLEADNRFTEEAVAFAINQQMGLLSAKNLRAWIRGRHARQALTVGVLNAGNIPLVGIQDWLAVVLTGHAYRGVVSSRSPFLLPAFASSVIRHHPALDSAFTAMSDMWDNADAIVATGSDATKSWCAGEAARYGIAESHQLLRGHRYSIAVLDGKESTSDCDKLAEDILLHEGAGCRSVALVFAPGTLAPDRYLEHFARFRAVFPCHATTPGALEMSRALLKAIDAPHAYGDGLEFLVSRGDAVVQGPGHVRWVPYESIGEVVAFVGNALEGLQCVAGRRKLLSRLPSQWPLVELGDTQRPELDWCPDGIDSVDFLTGLA